MTARTDTTSPTDTGAPTPDADGAVAGLSTSKRQRLHQLFERGKKCLERGDNDYAHDLFAQCVAGDPGAVVYLQHFRANLAQRFPDAPAAKAGGLAGFTGFGGGGRASVTKAASKGAWEEAFTAGCGALKRTPGDIGVLSAMAEACGELRHTECQLYYLRWALDLAPNDVEANRQAAAALESIGQFEQAIGCWVRVQQQRPADEEPAKAIARLSVEKTIDDGRYNPALLRGEADVEMPTTMRVSDAARSDSDGVLDADDAEDAAPASPTEESLRAAIDAEPGEPKTYVQLAELYEKQDRLQDAERLLRKAYKVSGGGDLAVLERLEDVHLRRMRQRADVAMKRAAKQASAAAEKLAQQARAEANQAEVEVYASRAERSPDDAKLQYELGLRLKRVGNHRQAIAPLQAARADKKREAEAELHLGECFQHIEQHTLAMRSYEAAIAACPQSDWSDLRKLAHYRAGVLAMGLGDLEVAQRRLTDLASADFAYRDVGDRLDKLSRIRKDA